VITDPNDYSLVMKELGTGYKPETKERLAVKAFRE